MSQANIKPVSRKGNIVVQEYGKEILVYDLIENKAFSLNETSALIWQLCDGDKTVAEIAENLSGKYDSAISEDFVWLALEQLKKDSLLENSSEISADFGGLSRREVIRKVGFATLVALPLVSSLIAPMAIQATSLQSCSNQTCRCGPGVTSCNGISGTGPIAGGSVVFVNCQTVTGLANCNCVTPGVTPPAPNPAGASNVPGSCTLV